MTCKQCLHDEVCNVQGYVDADECCCFRDKADFVEVVRCSECKKGKPMIFAGFYFCKRHRKCRTKYCFCSDGERK